MSYRCPLGKIQTTTTSPEELFKMKRKAWHLPTRERALMIGADDFTRLTAIEQQIVEKIGNKLYGSILHGR